MVLELLPQLTNLTDYLLNIDLYSFANWSAVSVPEFTPFQTHILQLFTAILCLIAALIVVYWGKYGEVISERFIRPISGTLKEIEELKLSVARLKLPREHTPRI